MNIEKVIEGLEEERVSVDVSVDAKLWEVRELLKSKISIMESMLIFLEKVIQGNRSGELSEEKIEKILTILGGDQKTAASELWARLPVSPERSPILDYGNGAAQHDADFQAAGVGGFEIKSLEDSKASEILRENGVTQFGLRESKGFEGLQVKFAKKYIKKSKKFNTYLREEIEADPERLFDVSELVAIMEEAVKGKLVNAPAKSVKYAIQTAIWYMKKSGIVSEVEGSYQWNKDWVEKRPGKKAKVEPDEPENLSLLDEAVVNALVSYKKTTGVDHVSNEVRKCLNFLEISKSLSSNLDVAVRESLEKLTGLKLVIENSEGWRIK